MDDKKDYKYIKATCCMDIEHTLAHGLVCIGLDKKARLILHGGYPIMAYYNPIILDDNPISHSIRSNKVLLVRVRVGQFWKAIEVGFQRKGFKL
jgi:hypothetical protein